MTRLKLWFFQCSHHSSSCSCSILNAAHSYSVRVILFLLCGVHGSSCSCNAVKAAHLLTVRCTKLILFLQCIERSSVLQGSVQYKAHLVLTVWGVQSSSCSCSALNAAQSYSGVYSIRLILFLQCGVYKAHLVLAVHWTYSSSSLLQWNACARIRISLILFLQCIERSILTVRVWSSSCSYSALYKAHPVLAVHWTQLILTVQCIKLILFLQCGTHHTVVLMLPIFLIYIVY
jgi:hypothetical protein